MKIEVRKYRLNLKFQAGTSRGVMTFKDSWFIKLYDSQHPHVFGIGECGPLNGLSPDLINDLEHEINECSAQMVDIDEIEAIDVNKIISDQYPALKFALETAVLDLENGGRRLLFKNEFTNSKMPIPINGLVWMGDRTTMFERIQEKIDAGFGCIKIKIGAINFDDELELLHYIRSHFTSEEITIRLDANGAFDQNNVYKKLDQLANYDIHSIEQPIAAGDWIAMGKVCNSSPIPVALDEELIGVSNTTLRAQLIDEINPAFVILKPTLVGGMKESAHWIDLVESKGIGWWITSALESNIGLNAIAQFTANYAISIPQGLGTGQLFHNNFPSPLSIDKGRLYYKNSSAWNLSYLN